MSSVLEVWLRGERLGELTDRSFGFVGLEFSEEAFSRHGAGSRLLSLSLPMQVEETDVTAATNFFRGLLPEGRALTRIAQELRLSDNDCFGLLAALGRDCAGALTLVPPGEEPEPAPGSIEWLTESQLEARLTALPTSPLGFEPGGRVRLSLAGAQDKLIVCIDASGRIGQPLDGRPSTHILKPPSTIRDTQGVRLYPDLVQNEAFCMRLAAAAGLWVARSDIRRTGDLVVLNVERFDREWVGERIVRIHQEDVCQALGVDPLHKYEQHGGPSLAQIAEVLRRYAAAPIADTLSLLELVTFNLAIGNTDAHGKNFALLHLEQGGVRLAPAYDLVSTVVYPRHESRLAMRIGGVEEIDSVGRGQILEAYESCGITSGIARRRLDETIERLTSVLPSVIENARAEGWDCPLINQIGERVSATTGTLGG